MTIGMDCEIDKSLLDQPSRGIAKVLPAPVTVPEPFRDQVMSDYLHDLRTPLVALRGYAKMLQEERVGPLNPLQKNYIQIVVENSQRLVRVLNEHTQVAAMDPMTFEKANIQSLLEQLLASLQERQLGRSILVEESSHLANPWIWGDPEQLTEAFAEILARVLDATPSQAEILVTFLQLDNRIHVHVSDGALSFDARTNSYAGADMKFPKVPAGNSLNRVGGLSV